MKLKTIQLEEVLAELPEIAPLHPSAHDELFICALGFEPRSLAVPEQLVAGNYRCNRAIYVRYDNNLPENNSNLPALLTALTSISQKDPLQIAESEVCTRLRELVGEL